MLAPARGLGFVPAGVRLVHAPVAGFPLPDILGRRQVTAVAGHAGPAAEHDQTWAVFVDGGRLHVARIGQRRGTGAPMRVQVADSVAGTVPRAK